MRTFTDLFRNGRRHPLRIAAALVLGGLVLTVACREKRDEILPPGPELDGREYYPTLAVGNFREYDVVDHYWQFNHDSVVSYRMRERIDTVFVGADGQQNYRIVRARWNEPSSRWLDDSVMAVAVGADNVRLTYANRPMLELIFPLREGRSWNPNLLTDSVATVRTCQNLGQPLTLPNGHTFDKTLRVVDDKEDNVIRVRSQEAAYAWNIGRVYRKRRILDYCNEREAGQGLCQIGTGYIARGFEREEQLRDWGPR